MEEEAEPSQESEKARGRKFLKIENGREGCVLGKASLGRGRTFKHAQTNPPKKKKKHQPKKTKKHTKTTPQQQQNNQKTNTGVGRRSCRDERVR